MTESADAGFMSRALQLAERGLYTTDPNPRVGCVLVKDGVIVGEGYHYRAGGPHAEREALAVAGEKAKGAAAYVTLEPCCHQGKTPPCTHALIDAGISRLIYAMQDPNPQVAGQGHAQLSTAGIEVSSGLLEQQAKALNPGFIKRMTQGRPFVRCKMAMSLDARTSMASGESKWITGEMARRDVHRLRARSSAILTGISTVVADDPSMNVRLQMADLPGVRNDADIRQPLRVVLDSGLRTPPEARMLGLPGGTLVITSETIHSPVAQKLQDRGAEVVYLDSVEGHFDLEQVLALLAEREVNEVLLETGPVLSGAALQAGLVDELVIYMAPHLMGDKARGLFHLPGLNQMSDRIHLDIRDIRAVGQDWRITAVPGNT